MSADLQASVVLISSTDKKNTSFGTGFIIHSTEQTSYLLTCAHVVKDVAGEERGVDAGGTSARVIASGETNGLDLAVLQTEKRVNKPALKPGVSGRKGGAFIAAGYQRFGQQFLIRSLQGILGESVGLTMRGQSELINAWDLKIEDEYQLQPGYSGAPVIDQTTGQVLAVASHRQGQGDRGLAISLEALPKIWPDMPSNLFSPVQPSAAADQTRPLTPSAVQTPEGVKVVFSYAEKDALLRDELATHLKVLERQKKISTWYAGNVDAGKEAAAEINAQLNAADIILLLISPSFIASDEAYQQMEQAGARHNAKQAVVIPVILRPTAGWDDMPLSKLLSLPRNGTPVSSWLDQDEAFFHIAQEIRRVAEKLAA